MNKRIELLAPAANLEYGKAAIRAGADAVYIGGPGFGARRAAGNSVEDVAALVRFAHGYGARVYVAMNTLLLDDELGAARGLACEFHQAGVDALIVQDMAFLEMDLPPIALHASTQTFNLTPERVRLLEEAGFARVILERGASLEEIAAIRSATGVELEAFVHGAICVSYSGQCYLGHALCGRGGNRGACAQACRSSYNLENERGERLISGANLLSTKDLNLSGELPQLLDAGICSLKIEGRLKELSYVVNNTAHYHRLLEELGVQRSSSGMVEHDFEPDPIKSFNRGFTTYNLHGPQVGWSSGGSTRSIGEPIGVVVGMGDKYAVVSGAAGVLGNGDGVCFVDMKGVARGTNINTVAQERVFFNNMEGIEKGVAIYRNHDNNFAPNQKSVHRSLAIYPKLRWSMPDNSLTLSVMDPDGFSAQVTLKLPLEAAKNPDLALSNLRAAMLKTGGTIFQAMHIDLPTNPDHVPFIPNSVINNLRRELLEKLLNTRLAAHKPNTPNTPQHPHPTTLSLDFRANIANDLATKFYNSRGMTIQEKAAELQNPKFLTNKPVITTPYCIRRELGCCILKHHFQGDHTLPKLNIAPSEKLVLENNGQRFSLQFDCLRCRMSLVMV